MHTSTAEGKWLFAVEGAGGIVVYAAGRVATRVGASRRWEVF